MDSSPDTLSLHWLDGLIICGYLSLLAGIGYYHSRRQKSLKDYFLAGRSIGWLTVGLSLMAALNSGIDYMNVPSSVMQFGVIVLMQNVTWIILYPLVFFITLPLYRRLKVYSAYEYLEQRFNVWVRTLTAGVFMLGMFVRRANSKGAFIGGLIGTLVTLYMILWGSGILVGAKLFGFDLDRLWPSGPAVSFLWPSTFGFVATMLAGCIVSLLSWNAADGLGRLTWYDVTARPLEE